MAAKQLQDFTCVGFVLSSSKTELWVCHLCNNLLDSVEELKEHSRAHNPNTSSVEIPLLSQWLRYNDCGSKGLTVQIPGQDFTDFLRKSKHHKLRVVKQELVDEAGGETIDLPCLDAAAIDLPKVPSPDPDYGQDLDDLDQSVLDKYCESRVSPKKPAEGSNSPVTATAKPTTRCKTSLTSKTDATGSSTTGKKVTEKAPKSKRNTRLSKGSTAPETTKPAATKSAATRSKSASPAATTAASSRLVTSSGRISKRKFEDKVSDDWEYNTPRTKRRARLSSKQTTVDASGKEDRTEGVPEKSIKQEKKPETVKKQKLCCNICGWKSVNHKKYHSHLVTHVEGDTIASCDHCNEILDPLAVRPQVVARYAIVNEGASGQEDDHQSGKDLRGSKLNHKYRSEKVDVFQCKDCAWTSKHHFNYHRHLFTHRKNVAFVCDYCHKPLSASSGKSGFGQVKQSCNICGAGPMHQGRLTSHMVAEHELSSSPASGKPLLQCEQCTYKTSKPALLARHAQRHGGDFALPMPVPRQPKFRRPKVKAPKEAVVSTQMCDKCGYCTNRSDLMKQHMIRHNPEDAEVLQCDQCEFVTMTTRGLAVHMKLHIAPLACALCPQSDADHRVGYQLQEYIAHLAQAHLLNDPVICETCGEVFSTRDQLDAHTKQDHDRGDKAVYYVCYECGISKESKDELLSHQVTHQQDDKAGTEGEVDPGQGTSETEGSQEGAKSLDGSLEMSETVKTEDVASPSTYKSFRHKLNEMRSSSHVKQFPCPKCPQSFPMLTELNQHLFDAHKVTNFKFQCKTCGHFDKSQGALRKHVAKHNCVREVYVCEVCGFEAGRRWNLLRHKETAHNCTSFSCSHCDYTTRSALRITEHFRKIHLTEPPAEILAQSLTSAKADRGSSLQHLIADQRKVYIKKQMKLKYPAAKKICSDCGKLVTAAQMETHMNSHLGYKPFRCHYDDCDYSSLISAQLAEHIRRQHLGLQRTQKFCYQCAYCDVQNSSRKNLERHIAKFHHPEVQKMLTDSEIQLKQEDDIQTGRNPSTSNDDEVSDDVEKLGNVLAVDEGCETREVHIELTTEQAEVGTVAPEGTEMYMMISPEMGEISTETIAECYQEAEVQHFECGDQQIITPGAEDGMQHIVLVCESELESGSIN